MRFSFVADHFQYLAMIGPIALFAAAVARLTESRPAGGPDGAVSSPPGAPSVHRWTAFASVAIVLPLAVLTWRQGGIYKDEKALWSDTVRKTPTAWIAHTNLGNLLFAEGEIADALEHYTQAVALKPNVPIVHANLGGARIKMGDYSGALASFTRAHQLDAGIPQTLNGLAFSLIQNGRVDEALPLVREALRISPAMAEAHVTLGVAFAVQGKPDLAAGEFREALKYDPDSPEALHNLEVLRDRGRPASGGSPN